MLVTQTGMYHVTATDMNGCTDMDSVNIVLTDTFDATTTVAKLYPNPVHDWLIIEMPTSIKIETIFIFEISGKLVLNITPATTETIDVSGLIPGTYALKILTSKGITVSKFVKMW